MSLKGCDKIEKIKSSIVKPNRVDLKNLPILDFPKSRTIEFNNPHLQRKGME